MAHRRPILPSIPPGAAMALAIAAGLSIAALAGVPVWLMLLVAWVAGVVMLLFSLQQWVDVRDDITLVDNETSALHDALRADLGAATEMRSSLAELAGQLAAIRQEYSGRLGSLTRSLTDVQAVIEAVSSPVLATDADGVIRVCNAAGRALFGSALNPGGRLIEQVFTQPEMLVIHAKALRGERSTRRLRLAMSDGRVGVFEVTAAPAQLSIRDDDESAEGGAAVVLTLLDVTELATAMDLKTDFVANASHELRTPLALVRTAAETLRDLGPDEEEMRQRVLGMLERNAHRLEEMVRDLLDLARLESPEAELTIKEVNLHEIASHLATLYERTCEERSLEMHFEIDDGLETLRTDRTLLMLILKNLVENALKFSRPNTKVSVRLRVAALKVDPLLKARGLFRLEVEDKGPGIPLSAQQRIFERFYQVDPARSGQQRGTGLGLSIVKHAVKALAGTIRVDSIYGEGTTMIVELPMQVTRVKDHPHANDGNAEESAGSAAGT